MEAQIFAYSSGFSCATARGLTCHKSPSRPVSPSTVLHQGHRDGVQQFKNFPLGKAVDKLSRQIDRHKIPFSRDAENRQRFVGKRQRGSREVDHGEKGLLPLKCNPLVTVNFAVTPKAVDLKRFDWL